MLIINLCGAPGAGKSTGAAHIFSELKMAGVNAELVTEYAKDKTWEHNAAALSNQIYMFGKQLFRIDRCSDKVDVIVTDAPLFLSVLYGRQQPEEKRLPPEFEALVCKVYNSYNNKTYLVKRVKKYNPAGRSQTAEQSDKLHDELKALLDEYKIEYKAIEGTREAYDEIVRETLAALG